mmetsp:Transcript_2492/g.6292  ORF Transcript_2492/g.6292 Transcript_2492/m.6292 type:complete len:243 (-) Transcript_2492:621-1349(-)
MQPSCSSCSTSPAKGSPDFIRSSSPPPSSSTALCHRAAWRISSLLDAKASSSHAPRCTRSPGPEGGRRVSTSTSRSNASPLKPILTARSSGRRPCSSGRSISSRCRPARLANPISQTALPDAFCPHAMCSSERLPSWQKGSTPAATRFSTKRIESMPTANPSRTAPRGRPGEGGGSPEGNSQGAARGRSPRSFAMTSLCAKRGKGTIRRHMGQQKDPRPSTLASSGDGRCWMSSRVQWRQSV